MRTSTSLYPTKAAAAPRVAIYTRRSLARETSASLEAQRVELLHYARSQLAAMPDPIYDVYTDDDLSARGSSRRPGLDALLEAVRDGQYDLVAVRSFSRWTRSREQNHRITAVMQEAGCDLRSLAEPFVTLYGDFAPLVQWVADIAAQESEYLEARIRRFHRQRVAIAAVFGRTPFGMKTLLREAPASMGSRTKPVKYLQPDTDVREELAGRAPAAIAKSLFDAVEAGATPSEAIAQLEEAGLQRNGRWPDTLKAAKRLLRNPHLAGYSTHHGQLVLDSEGEPMRPHLPVVSDEQFKAVQAVLDSQHRTTAPRATTLLRGLVYCGSCGHRMYGTSRATGAYNCGTSTSNGECTDLPAVNTGLLEGFVIDALANLARDTRRAQAAFGLTPQPVMGKHEHLLASIDTAITSLQSEHLLALEEHDVADYRRRLKELQTQKQHALRAAARASRKIPAALTALLDHEVGPTTIEQLDRDLLQRLLQEAVASVTVLPQTLPRGQFDPNRIRITWRDYTLDDITLKA